MKYLFVGYVLVALGFPLAYAEPVTVDQIQTALKIRPEADEIRWKDPSRGGALKVRIIKATDQSLIVEKLLPTGLTTRTILFSELSEVKYFLTPWENSLHENATAESATGLRILWKDRKATISMPGSDVSETGITLAKCLRLTSDAESFEEAELALAEIIDKDADAQRKLRAKGEQNALWLTRVLKTGDMEKADKLAWEITEEASEAYPDAMLMATGFLADRHFSKLKEIQEQHPRWMEDEEIKPVRDRLYHLSLDFALYPSLFHGSREMEASTGLGKAALVYQFTGEQDMLKGILEDLAGLYPESDAAKKTGPMLEEILQTGPKPKPEKAEVKNDEKSASEAKIPIQTPPPKNYNLFSD